MVFHIGLVGGDGNITPIGKTDPQRRVTAEDGEIIRVQISGISHRQDNGEDRWGIVSPMPVKAKSSPAKPSSLKDLERLWNGAGK